MTGVQTCALPIFILLSNARLLVVLPHIGRHVSKRSGYFLVFLGFLFFSRQAVPWFIPRVSILLFSCNSGGNGERCDTICRYAFFFFLSFFSLVFFPLSFFPFFPFFLFFFLVLFLFLFWLTMLFFFSIFVAKTCRCCFAVVRPSPSLRCQLYMCYGVSRMSQMSQGEVRTWQLARRTAARSLYHRCTWPHQE